MKFFLILLVCWGLIICCETQNKRNEVNTINLNFSNLSKLSFNDLYEIESVILLETNDSSFIKVPRSILFAAGNLVTRPGNLFRSEEYAVFDSTGKFLLLLL